jgi:diadenosine tetraphosphate (Ap4A) HIT family hydrolase
LQVDHILPRTQGGTNHLSNLQALCSACNAQKLDRDHTDFHRAHLRYDYREKSCLFCTVEAGRIVLENELAVAIADTSAVTTGHTLIIPRRHVSDYLELWQPEVNAVRDLELRIARMLRQEDASIVGFNVGANCGAAAGQTIWHCHVYIVPRRLSE